MKPEMEDLRILRLAQLYEDAYEGFVRDVAARVVEDPRIRERLAPLMPEADAHQARIGEAIQARLAHASPEDHTDVERGALRDLVEVERAARAFYIAYVDRLHDPALVALFRALADEERRHVEIAEEALALAEDKARREGEALGLGRHVRVAGDVSP